jgi:alpha-glucosidase
MTFARGRSLELLVADDGVALRQTHADNDDVAWHAPRGTRAWLQSYRPDYEGHYDPVELRAARAGEYGLPALLQTGGDNWALLTESGLTRQAAARLKIDHSRPGVLRLALPAGEAAPRTTPWRVAVIGDLQTVVGSDLSLALGRPSQIRDTGWIRPGRVAWSWWSDPASPGDDRRQRAFVRAAAAYGWEYVLLDEGWDDDEVPGVVRYAGQRGVRVALWTSWKALRDPEQRERLLARWASWGVAGVKVDFLLSDSAARMAIYDDIARDAARHRLVVAFHGCTIPRGIQRTWPNVLTMEAVEGAERETPGQGSKAMDPRHEVNLAFTRNTIGSMDYTPVTFSARNRQTTDGHRLALAVVYESGLQHLSDTPESYAQHPLATTLLRDLPAAWDDVRLLAGAPDREVTLARRAGDRCTSWSITSESIT